MKIYDQYHIWDNVFDLTMEIYKSAFVLPDKQLKIKHKINNYAIKLISCLSKIESKQAPEINLIHVNESIQTIYALISQINIANQLFSNTFKYDLRDKISNVQGKIHSLKNYLEKQIEEEGQRYMRA